MTTPFPLGCGAMPDDNADLSSPGGSAPPGAGMGARRVVERLDEASCMELLSAGRIARLIYNSRYGPVAASVMRCRRSLRDRAGSRVITPVLGSAELR
jgi:hypothetical protein